MRIVRGIWEISKTASLDFARHGASRMGASLAFYGVLSLAPLLVLTLAVGGSFLNEQQIRERLIVEMQRFVGREGSEALTEMLTTKHAGGSLLATALSIVTLLFGASGVFSELQYAMNTIWEVPTAGRGWWRIIRSHFLSFVLVLAAGVFLLATVVASAIVSGAGEYLVEQWPTAARWADLPTTAATFVTVTILFAMVFKILPDTYVPWRDVWLGALITAVLFSLGKYIIGLYLGRSSYGSAYGAAGSLVVLVVWIYYSAQILFFGAELTHVYSQRRIARLQAKAARPTTTK